MKLPCKVVNRIWQSGIDDFTDRESARMISNANLFYAISILFCTILAAVNYAGGHWEYAVALAGAALAALLMMLVVRFTRDYRITGTITLSVLTCAAWYLLIYGVPDGAGELWMLIAPSIVMFTFGFRKGTIFLGMLFLGTVYIFYGLNPSLTVTAYTSAFKFRYLLALLGSIVFAGVTEIARVNTHRNLLALTEELDMSARTDMLTGLTNRRGISDILEHEFHRASRNNKPYSIVIFDIDHFKAINDQHGHECGDTVLAAVAEAIERAVRKQDYACRWGGEEFMVLLPETDHHGALIAAEKLRRELCSLAISYREQKICLSASFGVYTSKLESPKDDIRFADKRLYLAKRKGRNCVMGEVLIAPLSVQIAAA